MVRFARFVSLIVVAILLGSNASAEPTTAQYVRMFNQPADDGLFSRISGAALCRQGGCAAVADISDAFDAMWKRNIPNPTARTTPGPSWQEAGRIATREIHRAVLRHTKRHATYCAILAEMARHFENYTIGFNAIERAARRLPNAELLAFGKEARHEVLREVGAFDESLPYSEDWDLWLRISRRYRFTKLSRPSTLLPWSLLLASWRFSASIW